MISPKLHMDANPSLSIRGQQTVAPWANSGWWSVFVQPPHQEWFVHFLRVVKKDKDVTHCLWSAKPRLFTTPSFTEVRGSLLYTTVADNDPAAASVHPRGLWFPALSPLLSPADFLSSL